MSRSVASTRLARLQRQAIVSTDGLPSQWFQQIWQSVVEAIEGRTRTVTADAGPLDSDKTLLVDATAGAVMITLPAASDSAHRVMSFKKVDASGNAVTIDAGTDTIDGAGTQVLAAQYDGLTIQSDGTEWFIL